MPKRQSLLNIKTKKQDLHTLIENDIYQPSPLVTFSPNIPLSNRTKKVIIIKSQIKYALPPRRLLYNYLHDNDVIIIASCCI